MSEKIRISRHDLHRDGRCPTVELWRNAGAGVILFYPGSMLSPFQYRPLLTALYESGFAVAALHLTGHGLSLHSGSFTFNDLLNDGLDAERWLRGLGYEAITVAGHSQGGILTLAHAAVSQGLTAAFPVCGVLPQQKESIELTLFRPYTEKRDRLLRIISSLAARIPWLPVPLVAYLSLVRLLSGARKKVSSSRKVRWTYPLRYLASLFNARISPQMNCPVYFFSAVNDAVFTPELTVKTFGLLQASRKKLFWLPGGGHTAAMHPPFCRYIAATAASLCAGLGLNLSTKHAEQ
ncbi:MAG: alpha/beta fold hydrolase [Desulfovibrio sp.]|nr:alpha/beta fold hydrolase [Desulfovibrio sp.]